ncbi:MAG: hypothetical protein KC636_30710, partial [Myxococcales bacterium]|nr:hypothetical protein [Myxococcales bacterium]
MKRLWLDWGGSLIPTCVAWLIDQHTVAGRCDLRQVRCVLPGARAGRLLLRELVARCSARKIRLVPPRTLTPGTMVDVLAPPTRETASRLECSLAWMHVLRDADRTLVAPLFPRPPDRADWPAWHEFATKIVDVAEELAGELLGFGDVARCAEQLDMDREAARWRVLEHLHPRYHQRLADCGREDPHARRRKALDDLEPEPGDAL